MHAGRRSRLGHPLWPRSLGGDEGQDLAEYAMLAALIVVVVILAMAAVGGALLGLWGNITSAFAALP